MVLKYMSKKILTYVLSHLLFFFFLKHLFFRKGIQYNTVLYCKKIDENCSRSRPGPRSHPHTPDIQTVAGTILWPSKHSFVHAGYAFNTEDHFCSHCFSLSVAVVGYLRKDVHKVIVNRSGFRLATQTRTRLILEQLRVKYCSWIIARGMLDLSNAQVSNWYSSMFHNRYLLESILKPQVQMETMSYWHNFIKQGELLLFCLLPALWNTPTNHSHAKPRSIQNVHKRNFWFSIRGVRNAHLL